MSNDRKGAVIGLDIGFGDVKCASRQNGGWSLHKFPTAVKYAPEGAGECLDQMAVQDEILFQGRKYLVGESARSRAFDSRRKNFLFDFGPIFAWKAVRDISNNGRSDITDIGAGLPLTWWKTGREIMAARLKRILVGDRELSFNVAIWPQGYGCLCDYRLDDNGQKTDGTAGDILLLDIGYNTIDIVNIKNGNIQKDGSDTMEKEGISRITEELIQTMRREHPEMRLSPVEASTVLQSNECWIYNKKVDCSAIVRSVLSQYVDRFWGEIEANHEERIQRAELIILAGGGAHYLRDYVPDRYEHMI